MLIHAERHGHFAEFITGYRFWLSRYRIMARRWCAAKDEIDLVVKRLYLLVFAKVEYQFDSEQITAPSPSE